MKQYGNYSLLKWMKKYKGRNYIYHSGERSKFSNPVYLSAFLLNSFEEGDKRKNNWVGLTVVGTDSFYFPHKYKIGSYGDPVSEYLMVLRLSEQYLIRAEARAHQGDFTGALEDLNTVRARAGLTEVTSTDKEQILDFILHERRVELFSEWGHRWLDLKRTGKVDDVMVDVTTKKGGSWNTNWQLYPLPLSDLQKDMNLTQNMGY